MKKSYRRKILVSFIVTTAVLLGIAVSVYFSFKEVQRQREWVDHTYETINMLQGVLSNLKDVQSSQRGFIITGSEDYLAPYYIAEPAIHEQLDDLRPMLADNPEQSQRLEDLKLHVKERISIAETVIETYRQKGQDAAFGLVHKGPGKRQMDEIRAIVKVMTLHEENLLEQRRTAMDRSLKTSRIIGIAGLGLCFNILGFVFSAIDRESRQRAKSEAELQKTMNDMAAITQETKLIGRMGDYLRGCRTEDEAYEIIQRSMPELFPHTFGSISIFNNSRNLLQSVLSWGDYVPEPKEYEPEDCWALRQGRIHRARNDGSVPMCGHLSHMDVKTTCVCLPMQAQGQTIGQIFLGAAQDDALMEHKVAMLRNAGEQISLALANLNLQRVLREQSIKDPLTKLFNRRYLEETLMRECARAQRNKIPLCVLVLDIDHFKKVNDTYGHDAGDAVLVSFASLLISKVRKEDVVCRLGGEEFIIVLPSAPLEHAIARAESICDSMRKMKVTFNGQTIPVTVSIGVSQFPEHGLEPDELIRRADTALYSAKQGGRDRVVVFENEEAAA